MRHLYQKFLAWREARRIMRVLRGTSLARRVFKVEAIKFDTTDRNGNYFSMGALVDADACSICKTRGGICAHLSTTLGEGKFTPFLKKENT